MRMVPEVPRLQRTLIFHSSTVEKLLMHRHAGMGEVAMHMLQGLEHMYDACMHACKTVRLKAWVHAGTGEVARMIHCAQFQPQAAAFTSLLHMCAKAKLWQKALEVFQAMRDYHPAVRPNTVHFSSLISACATAGRWEEAMQVCLSAHSPGYVKCDGDGNVCQQQ